MPLDNAKDIAISQPILISEAAAATGLTPQKINRLIDDEILPRAVSVKVKNRRALRVYALPMVKFGASDGVKLSKPTRLKAMNLIGTYTKENWHSLRDEPGLAASLKFESGCVVVALGPKMTEAMEGLNRWIEAKQRVIQDPDLRGGIPVIRGTRIGVYEVAQALDADGEALVLEDFPALSQEDLIAAKLFAIAHPQRGRPPARPARRQLISETEVYLPRAGRL